MPGGSVREVQIEGRSFAVAADADGNRDIGGMTNEVMPNGDGSVRVIQTAKPWKMDGLSLVIDDSQGDQEYIQGLINAGTQVPISFLLAGNVIYSGTGVPTGDFTMSTQNITAPLSFSGGGGLTPQ